MSESFNIYCDESCHLDRVPRLLCGNKLRNVYVPTGILGTIDLSAGWWRWWQPDFGLGCRQLGDFQAPHDIC